MLDILSILDKAEQGKSKLSGDVLRVPGFTSLKIRHLLNNICSIPDVRYLEIGIHQGATFISAMYKNEGKFIGIDNFSEFNKEGNVKGLLKENLEKFELTPIIIDSDCWNHEAVAICPSGINVFFYDGAHDYASQRNALDAYWHHLASEFLFIVDDWNWDDTSKGTLDSFKNKPLEILYQREIYTPNKANGDAEGWWNGLGIFLLRKLNE